MMAEHFNRLLKGDISPEQATRFLVDLVHLQSRCYANASKVGCAPKMRSPCADPRCFLPVPEEMRLPDLDQSWIRFVDGRPASSITNQFFQWCTEKLQAAGKKEVLLIGTTIAGTSPRSSGGGSEDITEKSSRAARG